MRRYGLFLILVPVLLAGCVIGGCDSRVEKLTVMSWNVENLFDGDVDGNEYPEYDPARSDWGYADYHARLTVLSGIITSIEPDILLLQEIEGGDVLRDLCERTSLRYYAVSDDSRSAIQTGILSRFPVREVTTHRPYDGSRSMLKAAIDVGGERVALLNAHWRSRRDGAAESEPYRLRASVLANLVISDELAAHPGTLLILGGDLNTSVQDAPAAPAAIGLAADALPTGRLTVTGDPSQVTGPVLYDFRQGEDDPCGSYWYDGAWYAFDHLLCSEGAYDGRGLEFEYAGVYMKDALADPAGHPLRYDRYRKRGISDHFPVVMRLSSD